MQHLMKFNMVILSGILWSGTGEAGLGMGQGGIAG